MSSTVARVRNEIAAHTIPLLPESVQARIVGPTATWKPTDLRQVAHAPATDTRLLIGPTNYAGQGYLWARAAESLPGVGAQCLQYYKPEAWHRFAADTDVRMNVWGYSHLWKRRQLEELARFTHVIVEAGAPLIVDEGWQLTSRQIENLQELGLKVALMWHGTDVRLPSKHQLLEPFSPYRDASPEWVEEVERLAQANHDLADGLGIPEFVSNPYLRAFRSGATWVPTLSDPDRWDAPLPSEDGHLPVVLHVPSQGVWKGTDQIRATLRKLESEGLLRFIDVANISPEKMPALVASADIVVDGILNGQYGVASLEAMLSRRVAVAHTWQSTREHIREEYGLDAPVVEADPSSLEQVMRALVADPQYRARLGEQGRDYVLKVHSKDNAAAALRPFLLS